MNTLVAISASSPQVLPPESLDLQFIDHEVRETARLLRTSSMRLAHFGWRLRFMIEGNGGDWSVLGVEVMTEDGPRIADTEDSYREALGISRSNWYKLLKLGESLSTVPLRDMEQITISNAELLLQVDPALMQDYPWVQEAKRLTTDSFALLIAQRNRQHGNDREPMSYYRAKMPVSAKKFMEETVERFRLENGLATAGEALELLVADVHDRPNTMLAVKRAREFMGWVRWRLYKRRKDSSELQWLAKADRLLFKAYSAVRMERNAEDAQEVYPAEDDEDRKNHAQWSRDLTKQSCWADGPSVPGYADMADPSSYLHPLQEPDDFDGDGNGLEDEDEG